MNNSKIQRFALNSENTVIDIRNLTDKNGQFFCPNCHDAMIPRMGKVKAWHFAHKVKACAYESYLHALAKIRIAEWFSKSESIILDMETSERCLRYEDCIFCDEYHCSRSARTKYDLKKYYSDCEIEHPHNGFVADIFCKHSSAPLFIEIFVNHECTEEKKLSGQRIIELVINSEESIEKIVSSSILIESEEIKLYGFKRKLEICKQLEKPLQKFILYSSGKCYTSEYGKTNCQNYQSRGASAIYGLVTNENEYCRSLYVLGKCLSHKDGYLQKDCDICFWVGNSIDARICKLYKRCGNPKYCRDNDAKTCKMFREDEDLINGYTKIYENLSACKIWRQGKEPILFKTKRTPEERENAERELFLD